MAYVGKKPLPRSLVPLLTSSDSTDENAVARAASEEFFPGVQAGQVNLLHLPRRAFLDVFLVIMTPALEVAGRQHDVVDHCPDTARRGCAGELKLGHEA